MVWESSIYLVNQKADYKSFHSWHINCSIWIQTLKFEMSNDASSKSHVCHICEHKSVDKQAQKTYESSFK